MKYYITAESPAEAIAGFPLIGEPWTEYHPKVVRYDVCVVPRSFIDWLFLRPLLWEVTVTFEA